MNYYHIHYNLFQVGQTIHAGAMGNIIQTQYILTGTNNDWNIVWRAFQEQTFELVRLNEYPEKPSRFKSIFLFQTLDETKKFINKDKREGEHIFKIAVKNITKPIHTASMRLYERIPMGRPFFPALIEQARQYWQGINNIDSDFLPEIFVESDVVVLEVIQ